MARYIGTALLAAAALSPFASAQTFSACNPLTATCPADAGINQGVFNTDFTQSKSLPAGWTLVNAGGATYNSAGINLVLAQQGDSPTIQTDGYILFGQMTVTMQAATGQGIVSSLILLSDDLDEVDWEFTGTNTGQVQSNYFGKGDTTTYDRAAYHAVTTPQMHPHTYTVNWTPEILEWIIDGTVVRTLNYADAQGGTRFPQTPMRVRLGIWAGGDPSNGEGTIEWAGGATNYGAAPFSMSISNVAITNYSPGSSYTYGDHSGSYSSIKIADGSLMSNPNGAQTTSNTTSKSVSTSLSIASVPTHNPLTAAPSTSSIRNLTNATTLSQVATPTSKGSAGASPTNAAMRLDGAGLTSVASLAMGALALGLGMFV